MILRFVNHYGFRKPCFLEEGIIIVKFSNIFVQTIENFKLYSKMIDTDFSPENQQDEFDGTFVVSGNDDSAFFNMNMCSTEEGADAFTKSAKPSFTFGGMVSQNFNRKSETIVVPTSTTADPSASCNHNCGSCMWASLCKSASKSLTGLGSGSFIPKLG